MRFLFPLEVAIALMACVSYCTPRDKARMPQLSRLFWLTAGFLGLCVFSTGSAAIAHLVKLAFFTASIAFATWHPKWAALWLAFTELAFLVTSIPTGTFATKLAPLPFLLGTALWLAQDSRARAQSGWWIAAALGAECAQAAWFGSRGGLLAATAAVAIYLLPVRLVCRGVGLAAGFLPWLYPIILTLAFASMLLGYDWVEGTSSNMERSAMAAWCLEHAPSFLFSGPGSVLHQESTFGLEGLLISWEEGAMDPHNFVLSAWLFFGTVPTALLQLLWARAWWNGTKDAVLDERTRPLLVLGALAILTYTLSPPDIHTRISVALQTGLLVSGLNPGRARPYPFKSGASAHSSVVVS